MEEKVFFKVEHIQLEGLLKKGNGEYGFIIFHPHPLYGGDMLSPVVESISLVLQRRGLTTLRFNFRGSGKSGGSYDNGIGEQRDALAAIEFLKNQGISKICLVGYSFGAWVLALVSQYPKIVTSIIYVAPPVALLDFSKMSPNHLLHAVITGENDEFAPVEMIETLLSSWNSQAHLAIIDYADHFFFGSFRDLDESLLKCVSSFL